MKLEFRSLESRIVFDGSYSSIDFSFTQQETESLLPNPLLEIEEEANDSIPLIETSESDPEFPIQVHAIGAYHAEGLFYLISRKNSNFNVLRQERVEDLSALFCSRFFCQYENQENFIPVSLENDFYSHSFNDIEMAFEIIDTILYQSSNIVSHEIEQTRPTHVQIFIRTRNIFLNAAALEEQPISRLHSQIVPYTRNEDGSDLQTLIFDFSLIKIQNEEKAINNQSELNQTDEENNQERESLEKISNKPNQSTTLSSEYSTPHNNSLISVNTFNAYDLEISVPLSDINTSASLSNINNIVLNSLIIEKASNPEVQQNPSYARSIQSNIGPVEFYSTLHIVYGDLQTLVFIPIFLRSDFFSYPTEDSITAIQVIDRILSQSSQIVCDEIKEERQRRPVRINFFIETETIFCYLQKLHENNRIRLHYKIVTYHSDEHEMNAEKLIFDFFITEIRKDHSI